MRHEKIFYGKYYLVVVCQSSTYKIVKVMKLFKKWRQRILGDFFRFFYNYYIIIIQYIYCFSLPQISPLILKYVLKLIFSQIFL